MYSFFDFLAWASSLLMLINGILLTTSSSYLFNPASSTLWLIVGSIAFIFYPLILEFLITLHSLFQSPTRPVTSNRIPIAYHPKYNISAGGIEKCHPFDSQKYGNVYKSLSFQGPHLVPIKCPRAILRAVHPFTFLLSLCYSFQIFRAVEIPIFILPAFLLRWRVLDPMLYATYGSIMAGCAAVENGKWGINLSGGYHHASSTSCGGFCIYADITLTIYWLRRWFPEKVKKVMIIDLDAHQGNGHERDFLSDPNTFIIDFFNDGIYPGDFEARNAISYQEHFDMFHGDKVFNTKLKEALNSSFSQFTPDFILYNAGTDCMEGDPLGRMSLSIQGIIKRDQIVFKHSLKHSVPVLMVLSGGYQKQNAPTIASSISNLKEKFNLY